jgi:hypothetical protein
MCPSATVLLRAPPCRECSEGASLCPRASATPVLLAWWHFLINLAGKTQEAGGTVRPGPTSSEM